MRTTSTVALVTLGVLLAACSGGVAAPGANSTAALTTGPIGASLKEWSITLSVPTAKAGSVTFNVRNDGNVPHDLVIVKTDVAAARLPTAGGKVDESQVTVVGRSGQLTPGEGTALSIDLVRGRYVLVCLVIGHYNAGQFASFTAQ